MALIDMKKTALKFYRHSTECTISSHDSMDTKELGYDYILTFTKDGSSYNIHLSEEGIIALYELIECSIKDPSKEDVIEEDVEDNGEDRGYEKERQRKLDAES